MTSRARVFALLALLSSPALAQQTEADRLVAEPWPYGASGQWGKATGIQDPWMIVSDHVAQSPSLFKRTEQGWVFSQFLRVNTAVVNNSEVVYEFGGKTLLVGLPHWGLAHGRPKGQVQVWELEEDRWRLSQVLEPTGTLPYNVSFGGALSLSGDTLAVGMIAMDDPIPLAGEVQIFERYGGVWVLTHSMRQADTPDLEDHLGLGRTVAASKDVVVAGAPAGLGAVYVLEREGRGWRRTAMLTRPPAPHLNHFFGNNVAISEYGDTLVAAEPNPEKAGFGYPPGQAFVYERNPDASWTFVQRISASDGFTGGDFGERFGSSLVMGDDRIVAGAYNGVGMGNHDGAVYVFERDAAGQWPPTESIRMARSNANGGPNADLGGNLSLSGGFIVAGARGESPGAAYVFELEQGQAFCPARPNSTGRTARLTATFAGTGAGHLVLSVRDCPRERPGLFLASATRFAPQPLADGFLCLGHGPVARSTPVVTSSHGVAMLEFDPQGTDWPHMGGGTSVHFQFYFADPQSKQHGANLTNALRIEL